MKKKKLLMGLVALSAITGVTTLASCTEVPADVELQSFTVTFQTNGGSAVESVTVTADGNLPTIATPTRDGYTFDGWYTDANFTSAVTLSSFKVTGNITLYAKWTAVATAETYTVSFDTQVEGLTVAAVTTNTDGKITVANPVRDGYFFGGWYTDADCTGTAVDLTTQTFTADTTLYAKWTEEAATSYTLTYMLDADTVYDTQTIAATEGADGTTLFVPQDPTGGNPSRQYYTFDGWYTDQTYATPFSLDTSLNGNTTVYAKWGATYESVTTSLICTDVPTDIVNSEFTFKRFTFDKIEKVEPKSAGTIYNGNTYTGTGVPTETVTAPGFSDANVIKCVSDLKVTFTTAGTFNIILSNGSSDAAKASFTIKNEDGSYSETAKLVPGTVSSYGNYYQSYTFEVPAAGDYTVDFLGTTRIYSMSVTEQLQAGPIASISANTTNNDNIILLGREYSTDGLMVNVEYENGRIDSVYLDACEDLIGLDAVDKNTAGSYPITIKYIKDGVEKTCTYNVEVIKPTSLALFTHVQKNDKEMYNLLQVYKAGETLSTTNLNVVLYGKTADNKDVSFLAKSGEYTLGTVDLSTAGIKEISITTSLNSEIQAAKLNLIVLPTTYAAEVDTASVVVDKTISTDYELKENVITFKSITTAYQYLSTLDATTQKVMTIKDGTYKEKLYINIPNLTIQGATEDATKVVISAGYYSDMTDALGTNYSTRGSATMFVTADAVNFKLLNLTVENEMNTSDEYLAIKAVASNTQAVALYTAAVNGIYQNCRISGYHDTLEVDYNNNYFNNCYIEGRTDFIFGYTAKAYFNNCTIHSLVAKNSSGAVETNGGYIVATKPDDAAAGIEYGFVFNNCKFTADEDVIDGSVALARTWGKKSTVIVANSEIGAHVSTVASDGTQSSCARYCTMSGNKPGEGSNFIEYNNKGEGAISASQSYGDPAVNVVTYKAEADEALNAYLVLSKFYDEWVFENPQEASYKITFEGSYEGTVTNITAINKYLAGKTINSWNTAINLGEFEITGLKVSGIYSNAACTEAVGITEENGVYTYTFTDGSVQQHATGLYVKFEDNATYVTYNAGANGVVKINNTGTTQNTTVIYSKGDPKTELTAVGEKEGYNFQYWTTIAPESNGIHTTAPAAYEVDTTNGITVDTITLYAYYVSQSPSALFSANSLTIGNTYTKSSESAVNIISNDYISLDMPTTAGQNVTVSDVAGPATADDGSGLTFSKALLPGGDTKTADKPIFAITAKSNISITIYFTMSNREFISGGVGFKKSGELMVNETQVVTTAGNKLNTTAYSYTMTLTAGQTINLRSSSNRLVLFGVYAEAATTTE